MSKQVEAPGPDRTQTLSVEPLTREEILALLKCEPADGFWSARRKLRAALFQPEHQGDNPWLDDLRGVIDRACEAVSKGDAPDAIAAYIWSNVQAHLPSSQPPAGEVKRLRERLLDEDGPVLLALREAVSEEMDGGDFRDENGGLVAYNDPAVEALGDRLSDLVQTKLDAALPAAVSASSDSQGDQERCETCFSPLRSQRNSVETRVGEPDSLVLCEDAWHSPDCNPAPTQVEGGKKPRCPTCLSSNPWFTQCIDIGQAEGEGLKVPQRGLRGGCSDPWHDERIAALSEQPEVEDEGAWPEVTMERANSDWGVVLAPPDGLRISGCQYRRYVPATSQDSSGLEGAQRALKLALGGLRKAEAERDEAEANHQAAEKALERAEAALKELAENFKGRSSEAGLLDAIQGTWKHAALLAREKAAKLKEGKQ